MIHGRGSEWKDQSPNHEEKKKEALAKAHEWWEMDPVFLDTETTGLDERAEVVEIAIVDSDGTVQLETTVKPVGSISQESSNIHGITESDVTDSPRWPEIHEDVIEIIHNNPVVIYNFDFDTRIIDQTLSYHWFLKDDISWPKARCAMKLYAQYQGSWNEYFGNYAWHKLEHAANHLNITMNQSHRARVDAETTRKVIKTMADIQENPSMEPDNDDVDIPEGWVPGQ